MLLSGLWRYLGHCSGQGLIEGLAQAPGLEKPSLGYPREIVFRQPDIPPRDLAITHWNAGHQANRIAGEAS